MYTYRPRLNEFPHLADLDGEEIATFTPADDYLLDHDYPEPLFYVTFANGAHGTATIDEIEGA